MFIVLCISHCFFNQHLYHLPLSKKSQSYTEVLLLSSFYSVLQISRVYFQDSTNSFRDSQSQQFTPDNGGLNHFFLCACLKCQTNKQSNHLAPFHHFVVSELKFAPHSCKHLFLLTVLRSQCVGALLLVKQIPLWTFKAKLQLSKPQ